MKPSVGRIVHYVCPTMPDGTNECAAAVITHVEFGATVYDQDTGAPSVGDYATLTIFRPMMQSFNRFTRQDEETKAAGTWHWPERVE